MRLRALLSLPPSAQDPKSPLAPELARAFLRAATRDPEPAVRTEALARLLAFDEPVRKAVFAVLALPSNPATATELDLARAAAASAVAASGAARPGAPGHDELERLLATAPDEVRVVLYRALLRNGGRFEGGLVSQHADGTTDPRASGHDIPPDSIAKRVLLSWAIHQEHDDPASLEDDSLEASQRRARLDEERRALLGRPELSPWLAPPGSPEPEPPPGPETEPRPAPESGDEGGR